MPSCAGANFMLRRLLLLLAAAIVAPLVAGYSAAPAQAARDCGHSVLNDYLPDSVVNRAFPARCYRKAISYLQVDQKIYGEAEDDLRRAMHLALLQRGRRAGSPDDDPIIPGAAGRGPGNPAARAGGGVPGAGGGAAGAEEPKGFIHRAIDWLGPGSADEIPLPLLVLGALALLLLLGALASFFARRIQTRRADLAAASAPAAKRRP